MDAKCVSTFFVDHTWARSFGVNTYPCWHGATERTHTSPLSKEVGLTGSNVDLTFTPIEESPEKCGTPLNSSSREAMGFVDEANPKVSHSSLDHGSYNVHLVHVYAWQTEDIEAITTLSVKCDKNVPES